MNEWNFQPLGEQVLRVDAEGLFHWHPDVAAILADDTRWCAKSQAIRATLRKLYSYDMAAAAEPADSLFARIRNDSVALAAPSQPAEQNECGLCNGMGFIDGIGTTCPHCVGEGAEPVAQAVIGKSLLRKVDEPLPKGCYCKPGKCAAPRIMGRQAPCRDPAKAAGEPSHPAAEQAAQAEMICSKCGTDRFKAPCPTNRWDCGLMGVAQAAQQPGEWAPAEAIAKAVGVKACAGIKLFDGAALSPSHPAAEQAAADQLEAFDKWARKNAPFIFDQDEDDEGAARLVKAVAWLAWQEAARRPVRELTDDEIDAVWEGVPDCSYHANYEDQRKFARALLSKATGEGK